MQSLFSFVRELIDIPSVTGAEGELARFLSGELANRGYEVRRQEIQASRFNVLALASSEPRVVLCTHLDTVPPFIGSSEDEEFIYGRGACDAKGILAAMVSAADRLRNDGLSEIGLLFVVGEEADSAGAKKASELDIRPAYIIVGEPTGNRMATGHMGAFDFLLKAEGTAAHSAYPEHGDSAIDRLLDALDRVRRADWGGDKRLGDATVNIGTLTGGVAGNVIAPAAEARVVVRVTGRSADARDLLDRLIAGDPRLSYRVYTDSDAVECVTVPGFETAPFAFGSDIPYLTNLGKPLLVGPGSILDAHTGGERISKRELESAVDIYCRALTHLLGA